MRIAYDNGCNFLTYGLNRDPQWIAALRIFIDGLHAKGHTACARSFSVGRFLCATCLQSGHGDIAGARVVAC